MRTSRVISLSMVGLVVLVLLGCGGPSGHDTGTVDTSVIATTVPATTSTTAIDTTTTFTVPTVLSTTTSAPTPQELILQEMTLRQKAAQVLLLSFSGVMLTPSTEQLLAEGPPGGLLLLGPNVAGAAQLSALTDSLQDMVAAAGSKVGLFIAADQEGGLVQRVHEGVPEVPRARVLGDTSTPYQAGVLAAETATGLLEQGVNMNLAPVADVVSDPGSFLYSRTYSGDPTVVSKYVGAVTEAFVRSGLITVVKHFPGHGSASGNTHGEAVASDATQTELATTHLPPFKAALAAGADGVMMAHVIVNAYDPERPASLSRPVVSGLLRDGLGFPGLVVTDDLRMAGAAASQAVEESEAAADVGELAVIALEAGCDLLIHTGTLEQHLSIIDAIVDAVQNGRLSERRLDQAVAHVLDVKLRHDIVAPSPVPLLP